MVAAVVVIIGMLAVAWTWHDRVTTLEAAESQTRALARLLEEHARRVFETVDVLLRAEAEEIRKEGLGALAGSQIHWQRLRRLARSLPQEGTAFVFTPQGDAVLHSGTFPTPAVNVADREYFQAIVSGHEGMHIGRLIRGRLSSHMIFTAARAVRDNQGNLLALVLVTIRADYFARLQEITALGPESVAALIRDPDGHFVVRKPLTDRTMEISVAGSSIFTSLRQFQQGTMTDISPVDGVRRVTSFRRLPEFGLVVLAAMGEGAALRPFYQRLVWRLALVIAAIGPIGILAWTLRRTSEREEEAWHRMHLSLRAAQMGAVDWDPGTGKVFRTDETDRLFGLEPGEGDGSDAFLSRIHPADLPVLQERVNAALRQGGIVSHEFRVLWPDGSTHWLCARGEGLRDNSRRMAKISCVLWDISLRRQTEAELERLNRRLSGVLENVSEGFIAFNSDLRPIYVNRVAEAVMGIPGNRPPGFAVAAGIAPSSTDQDGFRRGDPILPRLRRMMQSGTPAHFEDYYPPKNIWIEGHAYPSEDGAALFFRDVTARREMEAAVRREVDERRRTEQILRTLYTIAPVGLCFVDCDHRFQSANGYLAELLGTAPEAMVGRPLAETLPPGMAAQVQELHRTVIFTGSPARQVELQVALPGPGPTPHLRTWTLDCSPVFAENGAVSGVNTVIQDVTAAREAAHRAATNEDYLRNVLDALPHVFVGVLTPEGVLLEANRTALISAGTTLDNVRGRPFADSVWWSHSEEARAAVRQAITAAQSGRCPRLDIVQHTRDGRSLVVDFTLAPLTDAKGRITHLIPSGIDVTTRVETERALRQAQEEAMLAKAEAERASLARSKFLAAASHDLRQPIQSLMLLNSVLKGRLKGTPEETVSNHMEGALGSLRELLDSLLDISKLDAGVITPRFEHVAVGPLLERLATEYRLRATSRGLGFRFVTTRAGIRTDTALLERVLRNLLENALRYTTSGKILLGCRRRGDQLRIEVCDTGIGIAAEHLESVFDEFYQVANTARDRSQGLGLGLAIVRRIVRLVGGTMDLNSTPGRGSRFSIALPLVSVPTARLPHLPAGASGRGRQVLVIEDEPILRSSLLTMLEDWGYAPVGAANGEEALEQVRKGLTPAIVIADYRLSTGMNGVQTVTAIREMIGAELPCLIVTGDTAPERIREVHTSGFGILHKPMAAEELRRRLSHMALQV